MHTGCFDIIGAVPMLYVRGRPSFGVHGRGVNEVPALTLAVDRCRVRRYLATHHRCRPLGDPLFGHANS